VENSRESPFCEKLLIILEIIRDTMDDVDKASSCERKSSNTCFICSYLSVVFICKHLWGE
jgi:hypothetical protein